MVHDLNTQYITQYIVHDQHSSYIYINCPLYTPLASYNVKLFITNYHSVLILSHQL